MAFCVFIAIQIKSRLGSGIRKDPAAVLSRGNPKRIFCLRRGDLWKKRA